MKGLHYRLAPFLAICLIFIFLSGSPTLKRIGAETGAGFDVLINLSIVVTIILVGGLAYGYGVKLERQERLEKEISAMYDRIFG